MISFFRRRETTLRRARRDETDCSCYYSVTSLEVKCLHNQVCSFALILTLANLVRLAGFSLQENIRKCWACKFENHRTLMPHEDVVDYSNTKLEMSNACEY
jgi:hypothetical protein